MNKEERARKITDAFFELSDMMEARGCPVSFAEVEMAFRLITAVADDIRSEEDLKEVVRSAFSKDPRCDEVFDEVWEEWKKKVPDFFRQG